MKIFHFKDHTKIMLVASIVMEMKKNHESVVEV